MRLIFVLYAHSLAFHRMFLFSSKSHWGNR